MTILFAILLFSFLIFIHELGHFVAAKLSGVQVNEFALFMGPAIIKWKRGETLYSIRCIPIGGYCAMEGEDQQSDNPRAFGSAKWWKRLIILVAGSFMNFITGLLIILIVYLPAKQFVTPVIESFASYSTVNGADGLQVGDEILSLDGENIYVQSDFAMILSLNPGDTHDLVVMRNGNKVYLDDFLMEKHEVTDENGNKQMLYGMNFSLEDADFSAKLRYTWNTAMNYLGAVKTSVYIYLIPVVTVIFSFLILKETLTVISFGGCILIVLGLFLSEKKS